ncbi:MAG: hypothetical protein JWO62_965 [Acidimicrobiaceae bacterium]|nr:hypothetical protein [Acidimicrobiaceae bacterium]
MPGAVTISASYGTAGAIIGPVVAERLGLEFFDRAIPVAVAQRLAIDAEEALAHDERPPGLVDRLLSALANVAVPIGADTGSEMGATRTSFCESTEAVLRQIADGPGGVVLGRAAMVVLAGRPDVLCVRLDGPLEARIAQAVRLHGVDEQTARSEQRAADRAREAYSHIFYGVGQGDPKLYHLVIDSTAIPVEACVEIIVEAARARFGVVDGSHVPGQVKH